jgi:phosphoglycerol geranylgeranyltransferase
MIVKLLGLMPYTFTRLRGSGVNTLKEFIYIKHMSLLEFLYQKQGRQKVHTTLIDPDDFDPKTAGEVAYIVKKAGTDFIMVGGSTPVPQERLDNVIKEIKKESGLPVLLFPGSAGGVSKYADAILFMQLVNSQKIKYLIQEQAKAAPFVKQLERGGMEILPAGYLVFEPGGRVGRVGAAELIGKNDIETAIKYALSSQYSGKKIVYLEAGSGVTESVPPQTVSSVASCFDSAYQKPILFVGGGIKKPENARIIAKAGADVIVTGNITKELDCLEGRLSEMINAIRRS